MDHSEGWGVSREYPTVGYLSIDAWRELIAAVRKVSSFRAGADGQPGKTGKYNQEVMD